MCSYLPLCPLVPPKSDFQKPNVHIMVTLLFLAKGIKQFLKFGKNHTSKAGIGHALNNLIPNKILWTSHCLQVPKSLPLVAYIQVCLTGSLPHTCSWLHVCPLLPIWFFSWINSHIPVQLTLEAHDCLSPPTCSSQLLTTCISSLLAVHISVMYVWV
jgi:hypothetical protein